MRISKLKIPKIYEQCGKPFEAKTVITRFCSNTCVNKSGKEKKREAKDWRCFSGVKKRVF